MEIADVVAPEIALAYCVSIIAGLVVIVLVNEWHWSRRVVLGIAISVVALVAFTQVFENAKDAKPTIAPEVPGPQTGQTGETTKVVSPEPPDDRDGDGVMDAHDRCPAIPAEVRSGCPRGHAIPGTRLAVAEAHLVRFLNEQSLAPSCELKRPFPRRAVVHVRCVIDGRTSFFTRFHSGRGASDYFAALKNQRVVPWTTPSCSGESEEWFDDTGRIRGRLAFRKGGSKVRAVWTYEEAHVVGLIVGPKSDAARICKQWYKDSI
ncbi:MAG TPA: hypothetical protein VFJ57_06425 [Solirubrobacterales bacterium]|nr:hypothetical protein [Solirubrobacterales bacterium]